MKKVLVIDDDKVLRHILATFLQKDNFVPIVAADAVQGLQLLYQHQPDLLLLDVRLPQIDGFETLKILKQDVLNPPIPVIFLTADDNPKHQDRASQTGAGYLLKPFSLQELREAIALQLSHLCLPFEPCFEKHS